MGCVLAVVAAPETAGAANVEHGRLIAHGSGECFRCHGLDGGGDATLAAPRLAGLAEYYLAKQMRDFVSGTRPSTVMAPIARNLNARDNLDVAAFYAAMAPPVRPRPATDAIGRDIATNGDKARRLPACVACHGPTGTSRAPAIPSLAGQPASYLAAQLEQWRDGRRRNDPLAGMRRFAGVLTDEEVAAVSVWFAAQPAAGGQ